jgi:hypothetical protein
MIGGWVSDALVTRGIFKGLGYAGGLISEAVRIARIKGVMQKIEDYMGEDMKVMVPGPGKSDLILTSADNTKKIRFDIMYSHGKEPHVNLELWEPQTSNPLNRRMQLVENLHIYPENNLQNTNVINKASKKPGI